MSAAHTNNGGDDQVKPLAPEPPFVWPDPRVVDGKAVYADGTPLDAALSEATGIMGVLCDPASDGVRWIIRLLDEVVDLRCRLLLSVYPACRTTHHDLEQLLAVQQTLPERAEFRLLLHHRAADAQGNLLYALHGADREPLVAIGPTPPFDPAQAQDKQVNLVFRAPAMLQEGWLNWFERAWWYAALLTRDTTNIPALVPAGGSPEAAHLWDQYVLRCRSSRTSSAAEGTVSVNAETGRVQMTRPDGSAVESPAEAIGARRDDALLLRVAALCELGDQISINRKSGAGPLDAPMKAHWFGDQASTRIGTISREVRYRVSLLDREVLRVLENRRKEPQALLEALSFSIADGVRWIPHKAKPLFERELERANSDGLNHLRQAIGDNVDRFVQERTDIVVADVQAILHQVRPGSTLRPDHAREMLEELRQRLLKAVAGRFLPQVAYATYSLRTRSSAPGVSPYGAALEFLHAVARFPRLAKKHRRYFLQGLRLTEGEVLEAMNICDDALLRDTSPEWVVTDRAIEELDLLEEIMRADADDGQKCRAIMGMIEGRGCEAVAKAFVEELLKDRPERLANLAELADSNLGPRERWRAMFKLLSPTRADGLAPRRDASANGPAGWATQPGLSGP